MLSRLFILTLCFFFFMNTQADNGAKVATVSIGSEFQQALTDIKAEFGEPTLSLIHISEPTRPY